MQVEIPKEKLDWLESLSLAHGNHAEQDKKWCALEAVAFLAGEPHSDAPKCACPVLARFVIRLNDRWNDNRRQQLKPYLPMLLGTRGGPELELRRAYIAADWATRELLPMIFEAGPKLADWAPKLRALAPVVDKKTADAARDLAREARKAAADAYAAAYAADAAAYAAYAAAADAAADAAAYAAAAADAACASSRLTVEQVDRATLALLQRMIDAK